MVYRDPCYVARAFNVTEPSRETMAASHFVRDVTRFTELPRNRRQTSACGGRPDLV